MTTAHSSDPALSQRLRRLWDQFQALLQASAGSGELSLAIEGALNVDSSSSAVQDYLNLLAAGDKKTLENLPAVTLADAGAMDGAGGAYVTDLNRILINSSWLATASDAEVIRMLAEEYGHSLDAKFNSTDTLGDEGEKFAALLLGYEVPASSAFENDSITVTVDGVTYAAEAASTTLGSTGKSIGTPGSTTVSDDVFYTNSSTAAASAAVHTIYTAGGLDKIVIDKTAAPKIDPSDSTGGNTGKEVVIVRSVWGPTRTAGVFAEIRSVNYATTSVDSIYLDRGTSTFGYSLTGNARANTIGGGPGSDFLYGGGGGDVLIGYARAQVDNRSADSSTTTAIGGDTFDPGGANSQIWVNWVTRSESTAAAFSSLSAQTSSTSTQLASTECDCLPITAKIISSPIFIYSNNDIINIPGAEGFKPVNWRNSINSFDRSLYPLTDCEPGWLIVNFIEKQGKIFIYLLSCFSGSTPIEVATVQRKANTVNMALVFQQVFNTTALVPGQTVTPGQAPPAPTEGTFGAIYEDTTLTITEADFPEAAIYNILGPDGLPLEQTSTAPLSWTYTPAKDFNGTVTLTADFEYYKQPYKLVIRPVNDEPVRTTAGAIATVNEDDNNTSAADLWATRPVYGPGGGIDEISQTLSYKITAIPAFISLYKIDGTTAVSTGTVLNAADFADLKYKTVPNANGTADITFDVIDNGPNGTGANGEPNDNTLAQQSVSMTVRPVNDEPVRTTVGAIATVNEDDNNTSAADLWATPPVYGPGGGSDEISQTLSYKITAIPAFISLYKIDGTTAVSTGTVLNAADFATLKYKTVPNANGTADITFDVIDSGPGLPGTNGELNDNTLANQSVSITVRPVSDPPVITDTTDPAAVVEQANASAQDLAPITGSFALSDSDIGETLTVSIVDGPRVLLDGAPFTLPTDALALTAAGSFSVSPLTQPSTGGAATPISYIYDPGAANLNFLAQGKQLTITYQVQVSDGTTTSAIQDVTFTLTGTNDSPMVNGSSAIKIAPTTNSLDSGFKVSSLFSSSFSDIDNGDSLTGIAITGLVEPASSAGVWQRLSGENLWVSITAAGLSDTTARTLRLTDSLRFLGTSQGTTPTLKVLLIDSSTYPATSPNPGFTSPINWGTVDTTYQPLGPGTASSPFSTSTINLQAQ